MFQKCFKGFPKGFYGGYLKDSNFNNNIYPTFFLKFMEPWDPVDTDRQQCADASVSAARKATMSNSAIA